MKEVPSQILHNRMRKYYEKVKKQSDELDIKFIDSLTEKFIRLGFNKENVLNFFEKTKHELYSELFELNLFLIPVFDAMDVFYNEIDPDIIALESQKHSDYYKTAKEFLNQLKFKTEVETIIKSDLMLKILIIFKEDNLSHSYEDNTSIESIIPYLDSDNFSKDQIKVNLENMYSMWDCYKKELSEKLNIAFNKHIQNHGYHIRLINGLERQLEELIAQI